MQIEEYRWHSSHLGREMALKVYGHWGVPFVVFPCSRGRYFDYEGMGLIQAISSFLDGGKIKLFCIDSVDAESWYNFDAPPGGRNGRHEDYDRYVVNEVLPFVRDNCRGADIRPMTNGCSMGAYHAVNFYLKHPDLLPEPSPAAVSTGSTARNFSAISIDNVGSAAALTSSSASPRRFAPEQGTGSDCARRLGPALRDRPHPTCSRVSTAIRW